MSELSIIESIKQDYDEEIKQLQQENQQLKKQKDDVVEYIKNNTFHCKNQYQQEKYDEYLLRMLGEIDE